MTAYLFFPFILTTILENGIVEMVPTSHFVNKIKCALCVCVCLSRIQIYTLGRIKLVQFSLPSGNKHFERVGDGGLGPDYRPNERGI